MNEPTVACIMLANGRPAMVRRAAASFQLQTYPNRELMYWHNIGGQSIGALRNAANFTAQADIICHWDSDDWSHPNRIAEQVALLQSSGAECVGYNEMLFCVESDTERMVTRIFTRARASASEVGLPVEIARKSEAWLYRAAIPNYAIGTSMCYWRETWQRNPFSDQPEGCDDLHWFNNRVKISSVPSVWMDPAVEVAPRMIASIHGGNTCAKIDAGAREWTRVPEWDAYCQETMKLC
jgi:glycosyltransferase involved in cell wall biosynthesis